MNLNKLDRLEKAIIIIEQETGAHYEDIINSLIGLCFDEEEAGELITFIDDTL